jgi:hypothetical protein
VVATAQQAQNGGENGRHARGRRDTTLRTFEGREAFLHRFHGRIGVARIHHAGFVSGKAGRGLGRILEHEAGGEEQRLRVLVELAAMNAGPDGQGFEF